MDGPRADTILPKFDPSDLGVDPGDFVVKWQLMPWGIRGVEVTQAIQYYESARHLTDPADQQPDNSVTLIAHKPAFVRVYVRSNVFWGDMPGVTGTITVHRRELGFLWVNVGTLSPQPPGTVTARAPRARPRYATERGTLGYTLNFIIPAGMMCGNLRLDIHITSLNLWVSDRSVYLDATLQQTLRLAGIMVGYNGPASSAPGAPNLTLAAPSTPDLWTTSGWTLLTFPIQSWGHYRGAGTVTWNLPLTDPASCPGCCSPNWLLLAAALQAVRVADGNRTDFLYYGLMANGIPMGPVIGCESGGVGAGSNGDGVTMAHELGHACQRPHSPCGTPGDPDYPAYEPYDPAGTPTASIGEYGIDISNGAIKSPATFKDLMSYCGPRWVSLFVYGRLTHNTALDPVRVCVDLPWWRDEILYNRQLIPEKWLPDPPPEPPWLKRVVSPQPLISIIGVLYGPDELEIQSVFRLDAESKVSNGRALDMRAELVSAEGRVVASGTVYSLRSCSHGGCGCNGEGGDQAESFPRLIQAFVPDVEAGALLRIQRAGEPVWSRAAPDKEPKVARATAELKEGHPVKRRTTTKRRRKRAQPTPPPAPVFDELHLRWTVEAAGDQEPECWAQWSTDRGRTWHALAAGLRGAIGGARRPRPAVRPRGDPPAGE